MQTPQQNKTLSDEPVSSLLGSPVRVYTHGDMLTQDFVPERVNIELSQQGEIQRVWRG